MNYDINKYTYRIEWSEEDEVYICRCLEFPSLAAHGDTPEEALGELKKVVQDSIEWLIEDKELIPKPFSLRKFKGNLTLRVSPQTHRSLAIRATEEHVSINQYINNLIESSSGYQIIIRELDNVKRLVGRIVDQLSAIQSSEVGQYVTTSPTTIAWRGCVPVEAYFQNVQSDFFLTLQAEASADYQDIWELAEENIVSDKVIFNKRNIE
jgi:predicted RNase H-like HicB family nuclease